MKNKNFNCGNSLLSTIEILYPLMEQSSVQELTHQIILEIENASDVPNPAEYLAAFSQTLGFSKIWFKFCLKPLLLEYRMYFLTNSNLDVSYFLAL